MATIFGPQTQRPAPGDPWAQFADAPAAQSAAPDPWAQFADAPTDAGPSRADQVRAEYDAMPWYQKAGQAADDVVRLIANGMTFGYADKAAGFMNGDLDAERARTQEAKDRAGLAGTAAEITGYVAGPGKLLRATGITPANLTAKAGATGAGGFAMRSGLAAAEGAGAGALTAKGTDTDVGDGALMGAIFGAGGNALGEGLAAFGGRLAKAFNPNRPVPTADQLRASANAAYDAAEQAGVIYTPQIVDRIRQGVTQSLANMGYDPALQPGAAAALRRLEDLAGQNVTLKGLDTLRKVAKNGYVQGNRSNDKAINQIVAAIDDAITNPAAGDVLGGDAAGGAQALAEARRLWAQTAKSETVQKAEEMAADRAASTGKGGNYDNATRQNMRRILEKGRGYTPDEQELLKAIVQGGTAQNFLRKVGSLAPTGVVSGGVGVGVGANVGAMLGGPIGASVGTFAVPAIGQAAKMAADRATRNNVQQLLDVIAGGGQKSAVVPPPNAGQRFFADNQDLLSQIFGAAGRNASADQLRQWQGGR